ncbi:CPBP family intramembrane metalloprotease [Halosquirtibacter xylanolyticus]|uniref:type II CAAX endopeptidase family protein n=1 Tax=Halosquirtibacter xylanolyticus TaxID=3374599 RepID=UPI003747FB82|nr:CPBP family intramembrane metalloprotease [Prolixibacteraceae bacterium]
MQQKQFYPNIWAALFIIALYTFIQAIVELPIALYDYHHGTSYLSSPLVSYPVFIGSTLFILFYGYKSSGFSLKEVFPFKWFAVWLLLPFILMDVSIQYYMADINTWFTQLIPVPDWFNQLFARIFERAPSQWVGIAKVVLIGPIIEELIFRGIIMNGFLRNYSKTKAILISALLFGFFHMNPWQFIPATILGVLVGILRAQTGSIWAAIAGHSIHNGLVYLSIVFWKPLSQEPLLQHTTQNNVIHGFVILLMITIIIFATRKNNKYRWFRKPIITKTDQHA